MNRLQRELMRAVGRLLRMRGRLPSRRSKVLQELKPLHHVGWDRNVVGATLSVPADGAAVLTLLVRRKLGEERLHKREVAPEGLLLRSLHSELLVKVRETGGVALHANISPGTSLANARGAEGGTLGFLVRRDASGETCLVSCSHVLASVTVTSTINREIEAPFTPLGVGKIVAKLKEFTRLSASHDNTEDYALAVIEAGVVPSAIVRGQPFKPGPEVDWDTGGAPTGVKMTHYGSKSGPRSGRVLNPLASIRVTNAPGTDGKEAVLTGLVEYSVVCNGGDSGAPVLLADATNRAAGIHVGGDIGENIGYFYPVAPVLKAHGLTLLLK